MHLPRRHLGDKVQFPWSQYCVFLVLFFFRSKSNSSAVGRLSWRSDCVMGSSLVQVFAPHDVSFLVFLGQLGVCN